MSTLSSKVKLSSLDRRLSFWELYSKTLVSMGGFVYFSFQRQLMGLEAPDDLNSRQTFSIFKNLLLSCKGHWRIKEVCVVALEALDIYISNDTEVASYLRSWIGSEFMSSEDCLGVIRAAGLNKKLRSKKSRSKHGA